MLNRTPDLFDQLVPGLIAREAGYTNNPADAGGETIWGITKATARENGYTGDMKAMTLDQAIAILRAKYWERPHIYLLATVSIPVAKEVFDTGVNMGTGTAAIFLQRALNALNRQGADYADIAVDGGIGQATAGALWQLFNTRGGARAEAVILKALNCLQGARYIELAEGRPENEQFEMGWLEQRVGLAA